jgi:hypothetical protein
LRFGCSDRNISLLRRALSIEAPSAVAVAPVMRLLGFRPTVPAFDAVLREQTLRSLCDLPGVVAVYGGRHGPDELGPRLVASIWEANAAMEAALEACLRGGRVHPEQLENVEDLAVEVHVPELVFHAPAGLDRPRIIRTLRGNIRPGQIESYIREVKSGLAADLAAGHGPTAFYLARGASADAFLTLSAWESWTAIELATGGDIARPMATRHPELISTWEATHYEAIDP